MKHNPNLEFEVNYKNADYIVRTQKIGKLPKGLRKTPKLRSIINILMIDDGEVCAFEWEDLLENCKCTHSELKHSIGYWLKDNKLNNGKWIPIDIYIKDTSEQKGELR